MEYYSLQFPETTDLDLAWDTFASKGFILLYSVETPSSATNSGVKQIYGYLPEGMSPQETLEKYPEIQKIIKVEFDQIDWRDQWGAIGEDSISFDLNSYSTKKNKSFLMAPGPGFGDLSHPTTRLALRLMAPLVEGKHIIDLGCGSGVLSIAATVLGASGACGLDIDKEAIKHAFRNAELNDLEKKCHFQHPQDALRLPPKASILLAMNMIYSEQEQAWQSVPALHTLPMLCVTSGVLESQKEEYLAKWQQKNWQLLRTLQEGQWCGFLFQTGKKKQ